MIIPNNNVSRSKHRRISLHDDNNLMNCHRIAYASSRNHMLLKTARRKQNQYANFKPKLSPREWPTMNSEDIENNHLTDIAELQIVLFSDSDWAHLPRHWHQNRTVNCFLFHLFLKIWNRQWQKNEMLLPVIPNRNVTVKYKPGRSRLIYFD